MTRTMKDSGVEWIGEIPADWKVSKLKYYNLVIMGQSPSSEEYNIEGEGFPFLQGNADFTKTYPNARVYTKTASKFSKKDDILFSVRAPVGEKNISDKQYAIGRGLCVMRAIKSTNRYLWHFIEIFKEEFKRIAIGSTFEAVSVSDVKNAVFLYFPLSEQQKIADFLDEKCGAIDEIISKTEQSIEEYKKLKQSVITKTVTKGIRPNRPMQDSNIEWIGEIPENWNVRKGKYCLSYILKPIRDNDDIITCFRDGVVTLRKNRREDGFTMADKEIGYQGIDIGDLVVHGMDGFAGAIGISDSRGKASPVLNVLETYHNKKYIMYYLRSMAYDGVFMALSTGVRVRTCDTNWGKIKELNYPLPPLDEQKEIADYLDEKCAEIDTLIEKKQQFLSEMANYRKSLIYEYVTGKKEVA